MSPERCGRGLRSADHVDATLRVVLAPAFMADPRTATTRTDAGREVSIEWLEDDACLTKLRRRKDAAGHGVGVFFHENVLAATPSARREQITLERDPDNHGNIVYAGTMPKAVERMIAGLFALHAQYIAPP